MTIRIFIALKSLSWRITEATTPAEVNIRRFVRGGATTKKVIDCFGEPSGRLKSAKRNQVFECPVIIKYDSSARDVGWIFNELDNSGEAIETSTAD